jgi:competence ComEA-like helix-hairpin-helix protein
LNTANAPELQQVSGIGPATADKILKMRKWHGPFKSVDDLHAIKGDRPKGAGKNAQVPDLRKKRWAAKTGNSTSPAAPPSP